MAGSQRTKAMYAGIEREFPSQKEAYIFLVDRFLQAKPDLFDAAWKVKFSAKRSIRRDHFARSPRELFTKTPRLAENDANYARVSSGWFANTNIAKREKRKNLFRLAALGNFACGKDWSWDGDTGEEMKRMLAEFD